VVAYIRCLSVCLSVTARQCSPRGGDLRLTVRRDDGRIDVAGRSVVVLRGTLATSSLDLDTYSH